MFQVKETETYRRWERSLRDRKARVAISARLFRLTSGLFGDAVPVGQGVSELRIHFGPGYRIYFQQRGNEIVLLLCGGDKSTQQRDIALAKKLAEEWSE